MRSLPSLITFHHIARLKCFAAYHRFYMVTMPMILRERNGTLSASFNKRWIALMPSENRWFIFTILMNIISIWGDKNDIFWLPLTVNVGLRISLLDIRQAILWDCRHARLQCYVNAAHEWHLKMIIFRMPRDIEMSVQVSFILITIHDVRYLPLSPLNWPFPLAWQSRYRHLMISLYLLILLLIIIRIATTKVSPLLHYILIDIFDNTPSFIGQYFIDFI